MEGSQLRFNLLTRRDKNKRSEFEDIGIYVLLFNAVRFNLKDIRMCVKVITVWMRLRDVKKRCEVFS